MLLEVKALSVTFRHSVRSYSYGSRVYNEPSVLIVSLFLNTDKVTRNLNADAWLSYNSNHLSSR